MSKRGDRTRRKATFGPSGGEEDPSAAGSAPTVGPETMHHMTLLPPGQRKVDGFPRFGTHLHHPPPAIPPNPTINVTGAIRAPLSSR